MVSLTRSGAPAGAAAPCDGAALGRATIEWQVARLALVVATGMLWSPLVDVALTARNLHPFEDVRLTLQEAGSTLGQDRAVAWTGGSPALPGTTAIVASAAILFG